MTIRPDQIDNHVGVHVWNNAQIGFAFVGADGKWLRVNPFLCNLLGFTESEMQAMTFQEITLPEDTKIDEENVRRLLHGDQDSYEMYKRYTTKDDRIIRILLKVTAIKDPDTREFGWFFSQITPKMKEVAKVNNLPVPEEKPPSKMNPKNWGVGEWIRVVFASVAILGGSVTAGMVVKSTYLQVGQNSEAINKNTEAIGNMMNLLEKMAEKEGISTDRD